MFIGLIVLIVLMALCAILGAIYGYIYFTQINPAKARRYTSNLMSEDGGGGGAEGGTTQSHMFLFRKSQAT